MKSLFLLALVELMLSLVACQISMGGGMSTSGGTMSGAGPQIEMVFGDSVGTGAVATAPILQNGFGGKVAARFGWQQRNIAVGGSAVGDWAQFQNGSPYDAGAKGVALTVFGIAEVFASNNQSLPFDYTIWSRSARANLLHSAIAQSEHIGASTFTLSGSWTKGTAAGNTSGIPTYDRQANELTMQIGATATVSVTGTTVYVVYLSDQPSGDASFTVSIDGNSQGAFSTQGNHISSITQNFRYFASALRFSGLSAGSHTIVVTYASGTTPLILQWAAGNVLTNHPRYFVGNCLPEHDGTASGPLAPEIAIYNSNLATVISDLRADGLAVYAVDTWSAVPASMNAFWNDVVHPSQAGHDALAVAFETAILANP